MEEFFNILDEIMKKINIRRISISYVNTSILAIFNKDYQVEILEILEKYNNKNIASNYDEFNKITHLYYFRREL